MRPLRYSINVTLDGCVDHRAGVPNEGTHEHATRLIAETDAILLGRITYRMMEDAWRDPKQVAALPEWTHSFADAIGPVKKYVVSSTLASVDWNAELVRGDLRSAVEVLKNETGNGIVACGVRLPLALADWGLIDDYEFVVHPRIVGHGPTLFDGLANPIDLIPTQTTQLPGGVVATRFRPAPAE